MTPFSTDFLEQRYGLMRKENKFMHYEIHTFLLDKLTNEHVTVDNIYIADEIRIRNSPVAQSKIEKLPDGHYTGIITYLVHGHDKKIYNLEFKRVKPYYVYRVGLDDQGELRYVFDNLEDAKQYREFCYAEDEKCRKEGEYVPYYRYVITDSE